MKSKVVTILITVVLLCMIGVVLLLGTNIFESEPPGETLFDIDASEISKIRFSNWFSSDLKTYSDKSQIVEIVDMLNCFRYTDKFESTYEEEYSTAESLLGRFNVIYIVTAEDDISISCWIGPSALEYMGDEYTSAEEGYFTAFIDEWFPEFEIDRYDEPQTYFSYDPDDISKIAFQSGSSGERNEITDTDKLAEIVEKLNSFRYMETIKRPDLSGWSYGIKIYEDGSDEAPILVMMDSIIEIGDRYYFSTEEGFFNEFIELCPD